MQQILKRRHLVTRRNMGCFQGLAILIVVCTVIICALQILCFFLSKKTRNVSSSRINEDLNGHNREPGNPRKINIQWPHLNRRKQPIEHSEQLFNQVGFMTITIVIRGDWLWKAANINDKNNSAAVYVQSTVKVHNPLFSVGKLLRNKLMQRFYWSIQSKW